MVIASSADSQYGALDHGGLKSEKALLGVVPTNPGDTNWLAMLPTIVKTTNHVTIGADPHAVRTTFRSS